ncbi:hypothetical protein JGI1_02086 [Candidatus Thermokryptus mobilis]|uniref:Uncharacterized protein n=1 Tax=Candidatus Thermokryptus mobilis TaxID=1643428 RepID=A0A0S4NB02_9BACT|nr:hypothetical protein JGI1_02086 [Candidatus Thermokryptus mobilis]
MKVLIIGIGLGFNVCFQFLARLTGYVVIILMISYMIRRFLFWGISTVRNDEVGLFADMLLYEYYFKLGKRDLAEGKFKIVETKIANYNNPSIYNFWKGLQNSIKRWENLKKGI